MHFNIAQKIFGIALGVLVLMAVVAVYSINLTAGISDDLRSIAARHLPASQAVGRINIMALDQGIILQRLFVIHGDDKLDVIALNSNKARFNELNNKIITGFNQTKAMLLANNETVLARHLTTIENQYKEFQSHGLNLVSAREKNDRETFDVLMAQLNKRQNAIDISIAALHEHMAAITGSAIVHADREEQNLLTINSALTATAALFALIFAAIVTRMLVRAVRDLAIGAAAVEGGDLDTKVPVTTHDEVGKLTKSFNSMVDGLRLKERIKETFGKYMDPRIVANLLDHPEFTTPGGERREMSVMFIDLKGFTSISEVLDPDALVKMVNDFFAHMGEAISAHQGVVDKYMGDAVMAYWGPPFCKPDEHARLACLAAVDALDRLELFRTQVRAELGSKADGLDIDLRIGVSTGEMIVGTIGSPASRNFTVMGDPVNLGSRLEGASKAYGTRILVSKRTHDLLDGHVPSREIDAIRVKGKVEPIRVFELIKDSAAYPSFAAGLAAYRAQDWDKAEKQFAKLPDDPPSKVYLQRIATLRDNPPAQNWDGVWVFETK